MYSVSAFENFYPIFADLIVGDFFVFKFEYLRRRRSEVIFIFEKTGENSYNFTQKCGILLDNRRKFSRPKIQGFTLEGNEVLRCNPSENGWTVSRLI